MRNNFHTFSTDNSTVESQWNSTFHHPLGGGSGKIPPGKNHAEIANTVEVPYGELKQALAALDKRRLEDSLQGDCTGTARTF
jgi:hypothetical protein